MKLSINYNIGLVVIFSFFLMSCEDFLEVDAPDHKIIGEVVFNSDRTALSAMTGIYNQLFQSDYSGGSRNSITVLGGLSADGLQYHWESDLSYTEFEQNKIPPTNNRNLSLWSSTYNMIYMCNSLLEGLEKSSQISEQVRTDLEGEAKFIRSFTYFYLVNLYEEVPLILTTDYRYNSLASQEDKISIYKQIVLDLTDAIDLLRDDYRDADRSRVNRFAALALLARVNLYLENWEEAERLSDLVLSNTLTYELKEDLNETFLANSKEAIWQISPVGNGGVATYTNEGVMFLFHSLFPTLTNLSLTHDLVQTFKADDKRFENWIGYNEGQAKYYPYKYRDRSSMGNITEYSMVLRLAEQYLIRAEARANQGNISGALGDIDIIRRRAGQSLLSETNPQIKLEELLDLIIEERRKELFTEWGHRWLDLKRLNKTTSVIGTENLLFPIPEEERIKNPNLGQNQGY